MKMYLETGPGPEFDRLLKTAKRGEVDTIIVQGPWVLGDDEATRKRNIKRVAETGAQLQYVHPGMLQEGEPPKWDPSLPQTIEEIEKLQEALSQKEDPETATMQMLPNGDKQIKITKHTKQLLELQCQLFRAVFGREPEKSDPIFWDRERETEGVFRVEDDQSSTLATAATKAGIRPAIAYAIGVTGRLVTTKTQQLLSPTEREEWEEAVREYEEREKSGEPLPLAPSELTCALEKTNEAFKHAPIKIGDLLDLLTEALGSKDKARLSMDRLAALDRLTQKIPKLKDADGYEEEVLAAAARCRMVSAVDFNEDDFLKRVSASQLNTLTNKGLLTQRGDEFQLSKQGHQLLEKDEEVKALARKLILPDPSTAQNIEILAMNTSHWITKLDGLFGRGQWSLDEFYEIEDDIVRRVAKKLNILLAAEEHLPQLRLFLQDWNAQAFARLEIGTQLAWALAFTDPSTEEARAPWSVWSMLPPNGMLGYANGPYIARLWCVGSNPVLAVLNQADPTHVLLLHDPPNPLPLVDIEALKPHLAHACRCLVKSTCVVAAEQQHVKRRGMHGGKSHPRVLHGTPLEGQHYVLSAPVQIDLRDRVEDLREHLLSTRKGGSPKVQFLVRGHPRNQTCGPRNTLRKSIWIEPFWKGPSGARILLRKHTLGKKDKDS